MAPLDGTQTNFINNELSRGNIEPVSDISNIKDGGIKNDQYSCDYVKYNSRLTEYGRPSLSKECIRKRASPTSTFLESEPPRIDYSHNLFETKPIIHRYDCLRKKLKPVRRTDIVLKNKGDDNKYTNDFFKKVSGTQSCPFITRSSSPSSISDTSERGRRQERRNSLRKPSLSQSASRLAYDAVMSKIAEGDNRIKDMPKKLFEKPIRKKNFSIKSTDRTEPLWVRIARKWNVVSDSRLLDDTFEFHTRSTNN